MESSRLHRSGSEVKAIKETDSTREMREKLERCDVPTAVEYGGQGIHI